MGSKVTRLLTRTNQPVTALGLPKITNDSLLFSPEAKKLDILIIL